MRTKERTIPSDSVRDEAGAAEKASSMGISDQGVLTTERPEEILNDKAQHLLSEEEEEPVQR